MVLVNQGVHWCELQCDCYPHCDQCKEREKPPKPTFDSTELTVADIEKIPAITKGFYYKLGEGVIKKIKPTKDIVIALSPIGFVVVDGVNDPYDRQTGIFLWEQYGRRWSFKRKDLE